MSIKCTKCHKEFEPLTEKCTMCEDCQRIEKITADITQAGNVITNKMRTYEEIVVASVKITNALADLEHETDLKRAEICIRPENVDLPAARIKVIWKNETIEERRLITIAKGYQKTLRNLEYREGK